MRAVGTAAAGEVDTDTLFTFGQQGSTVWAHYSGGAIPVGYRALDYIGAWRGSS